MNELFVRWQKGRKSEINNNVKFKDADVAKGPVGKTEANA
jgi:hypothetical protein